MNAERRQTVFERWRAANPEPTTELEFQNDFQLLIAVILSAQATDISVNKVTPRLFQDAPTPAAIAKLGVERLKPYVKTIGLYNSKASNIIKTCNILVEKYDSQVPRNRDDLQALPGVGRKTANVVLNTAYGEPTMAVDTHIFRVSKRTGLAHGKTPLAIEKSLLRLVPEAFLRDAHHWILLHGRYICKARTPECYRCPIDDLCDYRTKTPAPEAES